MASVQELQRLAAERQEAYERLRAGVREAHEAGIPISTIARAVDVSRRTISTWLEDAS